MADVTLNDALLALKAQIQALANKPETTAEDLAMLGFGMEKIAGRVSAVELQIIAEDLKAQINTLVTAKTTELSQAGTDALATVSGKLAIILEGANASEAAFNNNATAKTNTFDTNAGNKTTAFNNNAADKTTAFNDTTVPAAVTAVKKAAEAASGGLVDTLLTSQFEAGTIVRNGAGLVTAYTPRHGVRYSKMTYTASRRLKSWTETYSDTKDGVTTTIIRNYTITYTPGGEVQSLTYVAA